MEDLDQPDFAVGLPPNILHPGARMREYSASDYARSLVEILEAPNQESVWERSVSFFRACGFLHAFYGFAPDLRENNIASVRDFQILSTIDSDTMSKILENGFFAQNQVIAWAMKNAGIISWHPRRLEMNSETRTVPQASQDVMDFYAKIGVVRGCCIGFRRDRTWGGGVLSLVADPSLDADWFDDVLEEHSDILNATASVVHRCLSQMPHHSLKGTLTPRQREVLEWVAEGKTTADIAVIMGLSAPTVDKHLRLARQALGVNTTAHALSKAAFLNQVFVAQPTLTTDDS